MTTESKRTSSFEMLSKTFSQFIIVTQTLLEKQ